jgi:hypothetical protein
MTDTFDEHGRPEPPPNGSEWDTLTGFLDYQRATFAWKTGGLGAEELGRTVGTSTMTLAGLIKHLAYVEDDWFGRWLWNEPLREPWGSADWTADEDWDWHSAGGDSPEQLRALWTAAVERARESAGQVPGSGVTADPSVSELEGLLAGGEGRVVGVGPPVGVGVEEVVGPGCWSALVVPPAGDTAGDEEGEVALALAEGSAHAAGSSSGSSLLVDSALAVVCWTLARARARTSSPR